MCNCNNRARPDVMTSQQAADQQARRQADAEANIAMMLASARNAVANSGGSHGWYEAPPDPE